ncbi:MAG: Holliday junction resolvase RuvX [Gemmatimonadota bacterium]|nr:Holliday junction resolvase RuvX [Gemmatimonadota bacterium]
MKAPAGRVAAVDYGRRRIGVALSDPGRVLALPHATIANRPPETEPPAELLAVLQEAEAVEIVIGIPFHMDGREGDMAAEARAFGRQLAERSGLPVHERDERLSSAEAARRLREAALPRRRREEKGRLDRLAAAVLLEDFLAEHGR